MDSKIANVVRGHHGDILTEWMRELTGPGGLRGGLVKEADLRRECEEFLTLLAGALAHGGDPTAPAFKPLREFLASLSATRGELGFSPNETAGFVFSLKRPLFSRLRREHEKDPAALFQEIWSATELLDKLGLVTIDAHQKRREEVILRQQSDMLELSTPVVKLWDGILALPLIGTLDSHRTQVVMESLLERIMETNSEVAIIDITGVPTVDTLVAQHLMKTVSAARLMGVDCIISGVRPQIAQTIVHLGVALGEIPTKSTLAAAFKLALRKTGATLGRDPSSVWSRQAKDQARTSRPGDED
jgi:rsbT co-antagonist protein RsbR